MSLTIEDVKKIAYLARLSMSHDELTRYTEQLSNILTFVEQMNEIDTTDIEPVANPLLLSQRLRPDQVTESDQRNLFQSIAPSVEAGLYLVPQVLESE